MLPMDEIASSSERRRRAAAGAGGHDQSTNLAWRRWLTHHLPSGWVLADGWADDSEPLGLIELLCRAAEPLTRCPQAIPVHSVHSAHH